MDADHPGRALVLCFDEQLYRQTVYRSFATWRDDGLLVIVNHFLEVADRERVGRLARCA